MTIRYSGLTPGPWRRPAARRYHLRVKKQGKAALGLGGAAFGVILGAYLALPFVVKSQVNAKLARLDDYVGHVDGVSLRPWRGAVRFEDLTLILRGGKSPVPFISVQAIDAEYSWKALFHGGFVGDVVLRRPVVHYLKPPKGKPEAGPQPRPKETAKIAKKSARQAQTQRTAYIRRLEVLAGRLEWEDDEVRPGYILEVSSIDAVAYNIGTKPGLTKQTIRAEISGSSTGDGKLKLRFEADALAEKPTFKYSLELSSVSLPALDEWLRKHLDVEVYDGTLDLYNEAEAVDGKIKGYVKPLVVGLHTVRVRGGKSIPKQIKGELEKIAAKLFRNPKKDQIGTQVSFSGSLDDPKIHPLQALVELVRNAFVKALKPGFRGIVDLGKL